MSRRLKFVPQANRNSGCGPACLAMLAGISLKEANATLFPDGRTRAQRTFYNDMRRGLDAHQVRYDEVRRHRSWDAIKCLSLVKCGLNEDNEWHWVVYDGRNGIMYDPLREGPTKPDGRSRKISSYLTIRHCK